MFPSRGQNPIRRYTLSLFVRSCTGWDGLESAWPFFDHKEPENTDPQMGKLIADAVVRRSLDIRDLKRKRRSDKWNSCWASSECLCSDGDGAVPKMAESQRRGVQHLP